MPNRESGGQPYSQRSIKDRETGRKRRSGTFDLLALPQLIRAKIWNLLGFSHTKTLRLVCSQIKTDIDTVAGISSAIDSTFDDFPFHCQIAIRKVAIHEMINPAYVEFLKYPNALHELEIRGEISIQNFNYIIKTAKNLMKILIVFNKFVVEQKTPLFPLPLEIREHIHRPLSKLRTIKLISTTKKPHELSYVHKIIVGLLNDSLPKETKIESVQILMSHKGSHILFTEVMMTSMRFIHRHGSNLRYLNLMFRSRDPHAAPSEKTALATGTTIGDGGIRKDSSFPGLPVPTPAPHTKDLHNADIAPKLTDTDKSAQPAPEGEGEANLASVQDESSEGEETNEKIDEIIKYLMDNPWPTAEWLHYLILSVPFRIMDFVINLLSPKTKLESLNLEALGNPSHHPNNWDTIYMKYLLAGNVRNLKTASFHHVNNEDDDCHSMPINLKVFRKCKSLLKLSILCEKKEDFTRLSKASNISSLPKSLHEVHFERLILSCCQVFRLCFCYTRMCTLSLSYWSLTDWQFSFSMSLIKWIICLDLTDIQKINLVDTKIRFRNNRKAVRKLQLALEISTAYQDFDETRLIIDTDLRKVDEKGYAPRISAIQVTLLQPKISVLERLSFEKKGRTRGSIISLQKLQSNSSQTSLY